MCVSPFLSVSPCPSLSLTLSLQVLLHQYLYSPILLVRLYKCTRDAGDDENVAGADREADVKKRMKAISFPEMDADGLPSSYIVKVVACLARWTTKVEGIVDSLDQYKKSEKTEKKLGLTFARR